MKYLLAKLSPMIPNLKIYYYRGQFWGKIYLIEYKIFLSNCNYGRCTLENSNP